jgi:hypothetical protein
MAQLDLDRVVQLVNDDLARTVNVHVKRCGVLR